ncbi:specialized sigma subunit of RNA polymerase [Spirochaetia bacterium]|nr:specialized sigma subunit of RNA polymerase [Spirochaetia bacterium]
MENRELWLSRLFKEYRDKVYGYIRSKINNEADAEDLCSQVFLEVSKCAEKFNPEKASESTWIFTIARNLLNRRLRDTYNRQRIIRFEPIGDHDYEDESQEVEAFIRKDTLVKAMESLDTNKRNIIILSFYHGLNPQEIAERLNMSYANVCTAKSRALNDLKRILDE